MEQTKVKTSKILNEMQAMEYMDLKHLLHEGEKLLRAKTARRQRIIDLKAEIAERNNELDELSRENNLG